MHSRPSPFRLLIQQSADEAPPFKIVFTVTSQSIKGTQMNRFINLQQQTSWEGL
jgi:hypothetical protein